MIEDPDSIVPDDFDTIPNMIAREGDIATPNDDPEKPFDEYLERIFRSIDRIEGGEER